MSVAIQIRTMKDDGQIDDVQVKDGQVENGQMKNRQKDDGKMQKYEHNGDGQFLDER